MDMKSQMLILFFHIHVGGKGKGVIVISYEGSFRGKMELGLKIR
jgi:hypothetical protein